MKRFLIELKSEVKIFLTLKINQNLLHHPITHLKKAMIFKSKLAVQAVEVVNTMYWNVRKTKPIQSTNNLKMYERNSRVMLASTTNKSKVIMVREILT